MSDTTTITVHVATYDQLEDAKPDGVTWDTFLKGLLDDGFTVQLDAATIDDIATQTAGKTADELESRLR